MAVEGPTPIPFLLSKEEVDRVHRLVNTFLPSSYDQEFVADSIIIQTWLHGLENVSRQFIRQKCISEWRKHQREIKKNEGFVLKQTSSEELPPSPEQIAQRKLLIDQAVRGCLTPLERKILWYRFYDNQTLAQIGKNTGFSKDEIRELLRQAVYKLRMELS